MALLINDIKVIPFGNGRGVESCTVCHETRARWEIGEQRDVTCAKCFLERSEQMVDRCSELNMLIGMVGPILGRSLRGPDGTILPDDADRLLFSIVLTSKMGAKLAK